MEDKIFHLRFIEEEDYEREIIEYFLLKDKNFNENIKKLEELLQDYDGFFEIEDFIYENFKPINIETIEFIY